MLSLIDPLTADTSTPTGLVLAVLAIALPVLGSSIYLVFKVGKLTARLETLPKRVDALEKVQAQHVTKFAVLDDREQRATAD
jgi:hypothetical protein